MKLKSNKSAAKRFLKTGSGKIISRKAARGHLLLQKPKSRKRLSDQTKVLASGEKKRVLRLLPYV